MLDNTGIGVSSEQSGDLYVADPANQRIDQFAPDGAFIRAFGWGVRDGASEPQVCTGSTGCSRGLEGEGPGQFTYADEIAVDNSCAEHEPPLTPTSSPETCEEFDPSFGDVYVIDQNNWRVEKFTPSGELLLMFGGGVDHTTGANVCTRADLESGDVCGAGAPGSGPGEFIHHAAAQTWTSQGSNSIAVGPNGSVYVGDYRRIQEFDGTGSYKGLLAMPEAETKSQYVGSLAVSASGIYANSRPADELQDVHEPAAGDYELCFEGECTGPIPHDAAAPSIQEALEGLAAIPPGGVAIGTHTDYAEITFTGTLGSRNVPQMTAVNAPGVETYRDGTAGELVKLGKSGELLKTFDVQANGEPTHVALDRSGDLFVSDPGGRTVDKPEFRAFNPTGELYALFRSPEVRGRGDSENEGLNSNPSGIAVGDAAGVLYASAARRYPYPEPEEFYVAVIDLPEPGPPVVIEEGAEDLEPTTARLSATINPQGYATEYRFQYISEAEYQADGEEFGSGTEETNPQPVGTLIHDFPVSQSLSGLRPDTPYRFRAVAVNEKGADDGQIGTFRTLPPLSVRGLTTGTVAPEEVSLKAELDNNNSLVPGFWAICVRDDAEQLIGCREGEVPAGANSFEPIEADFSGLQPNTGYHYQLSAENEYTPAGHPFEPAAQTFTTEETPVEENARAGCGNAVLRAENNSAALPDCRAYEQVSPASKQGYSVQEGLLDAGIAADGERASFNSLGAFSGSSSALFYLAHRTLSGWVTRAAEGRPGPDFAPGALIEYTANLEKALFPLAEKQSADEFEFNGSPLFFAASGEDGEIATLSPPLSPLSGQPVQGVFWAKVIAESADLSRLFLLTNYRLLPEDPLPDIAGNSLTGNRIYELETSSGATPTLKLVADVPSGLEGTPAGASCGLDNHFGADALSASNDGSVLFYDAPLVIASHQGCESNFTSEDEYPNKVALFVRTEGGSSVQISVPPASQCHSPSPCAGSAPENASFYGASPTGELAWFTTTQPLIDSDADGGRDLYLARLSSGGVTELVQASAGSLGDPHPGSGAGVQGVFGISQDGTHAAFVATGVLTSEPDQSTGEEALQGADNLYVFDAKSKTLKFVARLCSGPHESGSRAQESCPTNLTGGSVGPGAKNDRNLWTFHGEERQGQLTPDGSFLLLKSYGRLTEDDSDNASDIYRYDFESGRLNRVSFGRRGNDANGNDDRYGNEIGRQGKRYHLDEAANNGSRSITSDGAVVIFNTAAPLVSRDTDARSEPRCQEDVAPNSEPTGCDVYQWEEDGHGTCKEGAGCISLISSGLDPHPVFGQAIDATGRNIIFSTPRSLYPGDTDGVGDVYDARVGGGFAYQPPASPCGGPETCRGPGSAPIPAPAFTSEGTRSGGNGTHPLACAKGRHRAKRHGQVRCVPNHHRKGRKAGRHHGGSRK